MVAVLEKSFLRAMRTKRKMVLYVIHSAGTDITVLVLYAGNNVLRIGEMMEHSVKNHIHMEEALVTLKNISAKLSSAITVKNGERSGTRNVE